MNYKKLPNKSNRYSIYTRTNKCSIVNDTVYNNILTKINNAIVFFYTILFYQNLSKKYISLHNIQNDWGDNV